MGAKSWGHHTSWRIIGSYDRARTNQKKHKIVRFRYSYHVEANLEIDNLAQIFVAYHGGKKEAYSFSA